MRAHRVKCQLCAKGVTIVTAQPKDDVGLIGDEDGTVVNVFAGALSEDEAVDKAAVVIAAEENEAREAMKEGEGEEWDLFTPQDIRLNWTFSVQSMMIRP